MPRRFPADKLKVTRGGAPVHLATNNIARFGLHEAVEQAGDGIVITAIDGTILFVNPAFTSMTGYSREEAIGKNPRILKSGKQSPAVYRGLWQTICDGQSWTRDIINRRKDGSLYNEEMRISPIRDAHGAVEGFLAIKRDVTDRRQVEERLASCEEKFRQFAECIHEAFWMRNAAGTETLYVSPGYEKIWGRPCVDVYKSPTLWADFIEPEDQEQALAIFARQMQGEELESEYRIRTPAGEIKWIRDRAFPVRDSDGQITRLVGIAQDITDRKRAEEVIESLAYFDALTGLPNRALLQDRLENALDGARRSGEQVALLFLDLDRFKIYNDSLGHGFGDLLLKDVARRLRSCTRRQDTVARIGGDEFLVVLNHVKDVAAVAIAANRLMSAMTREFTVQGRSVNISCSLGVSLFPAHGDDSETLIKHADAAMYRAKDDGRNNFRFFTEEMHARAVERLTLESNLRLALERNELFLHYQPQMEIESGRITGFEALLRWQQPEMGLIPPNHFIPLAESTGLILPIGEWVLRTACAQAKQWRDDGLSAESVAVNVSAVQFRQEGFVALVRQVLYETGLPAHCLELELTEGLLLSNADVNLSVLKELKQMGVQLAIDDFGTGYSSLSYLKQFRVDKLKIDRSFINDIAADSDAGAIAIAIISMARSLKLKVIAEGVENVAQAAFLRQHRCGEIQGYYFSRPIPPAEAAQMLSNTYPLLSRCLTASLPAPHSFATTAVA